MDESGLYESIRTGKFDNVLLDSEKPEEETSGEGTSQTSSPPRPPNIENMSRAEK
jgi:hypothetical protein